MIWGYILVRKMDQNILYHVNLAIISIENQLKYIILWRNHTPALNSGWGVLYIIRKLEESTLISKKFKILFGQIVKMPNSVNDEKTGMSHNGCVEWLWDYGLHESYHQIILSMDTLRSLSLIVLIC